MTTTPTTSTRSFAALLCAGAMAVLAQSGCESDSEVRTGQLDIVVAPESVISSGLAPGAAPGQISDGWAVSFSRYLVAIGNLSLSYATDPSQTLGDPRVFLMDLAKLPGTGAQAWSLQLASGSWNISYNTAIATPQSVLPPDPGTDLPLFQQMIAQQWTYLIHGVMRKADGRSCPPPDLANPGSAVPIGQTLTGTPCYAAPELRFEIGAPAPTVFGPCKAGGVPGVVVNPDLVATAALSIHGDHIFFNGFPEGSEGGVTRISQWLADCDLNLDGVVTQEELKMIPLPSLAALGSNVQLGGSPISPLLTVYDYVRAQLKTQGHFQGEGECAMDGKDHDHGDHGDHGNHGHG